MQSMWTRHDISSHTASHVTCWSLQFVEGQPVTEWLKSVMCLLTETLQLSRTPGLRLLARSETTAGQSPIGRQPIVPDGAFVSVTGSSPVMSDTFYLTRGNIKDA